jgi:predicted ATPase/class 3 adenylate cyclase
MTSTDLQAYLPRFIVRELSRQPVNALIGRTMAFEAVTLFADVAGFTPLSETLARQGKAGAEELTEILNRTFAVLIDLVHTHGGTITRFGGDSICAVFPCTKRNQAQAARRAVACAYEMLREVSRQPVKTGVGDFDVSMKAGLSCGQVIWTIVGDAASRDAASRDPVSRLEYVVAGRAIQSCVAAENAAVKDEVVLDRDLSMWVGEFASLTPVERGEGLCRVQSIQPQRREQPQRIARPSDSQPSRDALETLTHFLHPVIVERSTEALAGFVNEHRKVTVLFAGSGEFDPASDQIGHALQAYFAEAVRIARRYDGHLARIDADETGIRGMLLFGAPLAHEDDEARALRCALDVRRLSHAGSRIGVNTGFAFCANIGSQTRREYTVMGDAVNLAARLMQVAQPDQIVVGATTYREGTRRASSEQFEWHELGHISVKGKSDSIPAFALQDVTTSMPAKTRRLDPPLIGREIELAQATAALERALQGEGQIIVVTAEAGMGKSRLASEIAGVAARRGFQVHTGAGEAYASITSYSAWHAIWRGLFGLDPALPPAQQVDRLEAKLARMGSDLVERLSLLAPVLNLAIPEKEWMAALDPHQRTDLMKFMLLDCLRRWTTERPLLLIVEDCHWLDPLSQDLLRFLIDNAGGLRLALLLLYRSGEGEQHEPDWATTGAAADRVNHISLTGLDADRSAELIRRKWRERCGEGAGEISPELMNAIAEKAQGNPLYIEGLVNYVCERGADATPSHPPPSGGGVRAGDHSANATPSHPPPLGGRGVQQLDLPDNLRSLILSRIDRLDADNQIVLKVASVIGREFNAGWLRGCLRSTELAASAPEHLADLCRLDLMQPVTTAPHTAPDTAPEERFAFKHGLIQETAYDSLAFAQRSSLHEQVGLFIEQHYAERAAELVDTLAFHFGRTHNVDKQRLYFRKAGDAARATYANAAAIDYYTRLLPLLPAPEQIDVLLGLGSVAQLIGEWDEAESRFRQALVIADEARDVHAQAECWRALGELYSRRTSYADAAIWLERACQAYERLGDDIGLSRTLGQLSYAHFEQGNRERAIDLSTRHFKIASEAHDEKAIADSLHSLGIILAQQGALDSAQSHFNRAIEFAMRADDKLRIIHVANDVARLHWQRGDYSRALSSLEQAMHAAKEVGYRSLSSVMMGNTGVLYWEVGEFDRALTCYGHSLDIALSIGDQPSILTCLGNIALVFYERQRDEMAKRVLARAIALGRELNVPYLQCEHLHTMANLMTRHGKYTEAASLNLEALTLAEQVNDVEVLLKARLLAARLRVFMGKSLASIVIDELSQMLDTAADDGLAAVYYAIWQVDPAHDDARRLAAEAYRRLHDRIPRHEFRARYAELTGAQLPKAVALPSLLPEKPHPWEDLDRLLSRAGVDLSSRPVALQGEATAAIIHQELQAPPSSR